LPMTMTRSSGDDESDPGEIAIFYQWQGSYSQEEMGREVAKVEDYINRNRERFHVEKVYSRYSEQGWAITELDLDVKDPKVNAKVQEELREGLPKSALANIGIGRQGGMGGSEQSVQFSLIGES